ncbi:DNA alkylation repair protein [Aeromicrobium sp.]|jgi:3-methyladenine DNA glycosylase AlkD|uniref:DNA alkylation repair protein n=1 Tax=Aeromicrobium sp. TaxID=1871063 RepID=UPI0025BF753C|nr:DNA alkylation repair protein [Aeromicrobium sp.]MCK5890339.1 DNA alkylation repair protein [Aeromicrobium sp.]
MTSVDAIEARLRAMASPDQVDAIAKRVPREQVIGVRMKHTFDLAREHQHLDLAVVRSLLDAPWYELRMVAVSILDARARRHDPTTPERTALYETYLDGHAGIDTWDLVDRAAPRVVGAYLLDRPREPLHRLARSANLWERRTAAVASYWTIRHGEPGDPVAILSTLVDDPEQFVQTAVGTAVRELRRAHPEAAEAFEATHDLRPHARRAASVGTSAKRRSH